MRVALPDHIDVDAFRRRDPAARIVRLRGATMGTNWSLQAVAAPPGTLGLVEKTLAGLIAIFSHWEAGSAISAFNRAPIGDWRELPEPLCFVLDAGLDLYQRTGGAFDPAAGRLADLWGFGPGGRRPAPPAEAAIAAVQGEGGAGAMERMGSKARRTGDVALDLSGIAKGYAVDILSRQLQASGVRDFLVEIGGEFVARGIKPDGQPWWVELERPPGIAAPPLLVGLHDRALATSGDYRRYIVHQGQRLSHTLDPRTGRPVGNGIVSVSVVSSSCMMADAWATALTVLGADRGLEIADAQGLAVRIVRADGSECLSRTMRASID